MNLIVCMTVFLLCVYAEGNTSFVVPDPSIYIVRFQHRHSFNFYIGTKAGTFDWAVFDDIESLEEWLNTYEDDYPNDRIVYKAVRITPNLQKTGETRIIQRRVVVDEPEDIFRWKIK